MINYTLNVVNKSNTYTINDNIFKVANFNLIEKYDKSIKIDNIYSLNSADIDTLFKKANLFNKQQKYDEAIEYYDKALAIDPFYIYVLNGKDIVIRE